MPRARRQPQPVADPMPAETMFPLSELDRMLPLSDTALHTAAGSKRGRRSSRPSVSSRGKRTILKEPETRRPKNRGHLARNRKFESISLQRGVTCEPEFSQDRLAAAQREFADGHLRVTDIEQHHSLDIVDVVDPEPLDLKFHHFQELTVKPLD